MTRTPDTVLDAVVCPGTYRQLVALAKESNGGSSEGVDFDEFSAGLADICPNLKTDPSERDESCIDLAPTIAVEVGQSALSKSNMRVVNCSTDEAFGRNITPIF